MKTQNEIERDFYAYVKASSLGQAIKGKVYRPEMRPDNPKTEDIIVGLLSGMNGQIQEGIVYVNVYVPDVLDNQGKGKANYSRIGVLQAYEESLITACQGGDYYVSRSAETARAEAVEEIGQHCFTIRLQFKTTNY